MNFHKTIGYLAALLLMVGIGVPDSFAQAQDVKTISLVVSPRTLRDSTTADVTVRATVGVTLAGAATEAQAVNITISGTPDDSYSLTTNTLTIDFAVGDVTKSMRQDLTFSMSDDDDADDESITLTAVETRNTTPSGTATITITDHQVNTTPNAESGRGFRVIITAPGDGQLVPGLKDKIKVQVLRKGGLAYEFGAFDDIKIALVQDNGDDEDVEFASLTIGSNTDLSTLVLSRVKTATLTSVDVTDNDVVNANAANTKAYYTRRSSSAGYDILEVRFHVLAGTHDKVYATATLGLPDGADEVVLESRDTKTSIFPANPASFPGVVVGDGKFVKIDADEPGTGIVTAIAIEIDGDAIAAADPFSIAGIGDKIKISATLSDFDDNNTLQFVVLGVNPKVFTTDADPVTVTAASQVVRGYTKTVQALDVIGATSQGNPVEDEFTVAMNQFDRKANVGPHEPAGINAKNAWYEDDNVVVRIRAAVKDRAGNSANQTANLSGSFIVDSRPPGVTILYPKPSGTDSTRFSAAIEQVDVDFLGEAGLSSALKPLNFETDEVVDDLWVIIGTDTLTVIPEGEAPTVAADYDLTEEGPLALKNTGTADEPNLRPDADLDPAKKPDGASVKLQVVAIDRAGNKGTGTPDGGDATFDPNPPTIDLLFPTNAALEELDDKIGGTERTQDPVFTVNEVTDSILVRYEGAGTLLSVAGSAADLSKVNKNIKVAFLGDDELTDGEAYDLQIYARDLVGHVGVSDPELSQDLEFDDDLNNPSADGFKVALATAKIDSAVAGQDLGLKITAMDGTLDNTAITYSNSATVVTMDSGGKPVASMTYSGDDVTDNGDGTATLDGAGWSIGVHTINLNSKTAGGPYTVAVRDMTADDVNFMGTIDGIVIDAADFAGFKITAWEENVTGPATEVWGDFDLNVVPVDEYGNPSVKAYTADLPAKDPDANDIRAVLDTRVKDAGTEGTEGIEGIVFDEIDVTFRSNPALDDLPSLFEWPLAVEGETFELIAPANKRSLTIQAEAAEDHDRVNGLKSTVRFSIREPVMISFTLSGPEGEDWTDLEEISTPVDGSEIAVTARAEGFSEGDMVTISVDGEAQDPGAADADGNVEVPLTWSGSGSQTVAAASGQYSEEMTYTYVQSEEPLEPVRVPHTDANGDPVYLVYDPDAGPSDYTVGKDDLMAFIASYGATKGVDDHYNVQADLDGSGTVDKEDLYLLLASWGREAPAPASKPIVLLPGVNENAEFSINLGSERVVAGEMVALDVSLANVQAVMGYGFALNYEMDKFEFVSVAPADEDLLRSTGGETLFHHMVADGQIEVATGMYNGTAVSGGGDVVRFVFRVLREFEDNARFEIAYGVVFDPSQLQNPAVVAGVLELQSTPREFALHQNFPNPFNPDTTIKYDLAESADVTLQIYNVLGQVVRTLVASEAQNAGRYQIRWNGMDDRGVSVSSGIYFYKISADGKFQNVRKLMLLK